MGLRDGILALMLAEGDTRTSAHQHFEEERWASVLELCRHYGIDPKRQEPVVRDATQLFDDLKNVHHLPPDYKLWLQAAAMMHSVGKFMNYQGHHRHTQYIIANSELYGFTPEQRLIVSAIARYLGKSRPSPWRQGAALHSGGTARKCEAGGDAATHGGSVASEPIHCGGALSHSRNSQESLHHR